MENLKVLMFVWKYRTNNCGSAPLYIRLTLNKSRKQFSTGIFLKINQWCQKKQRVIRHPEADFYNLKLSTLKSKILRAYLKQSNETTSIYLEDVVNHAFKKKKKKTAISLFDDFIQLRKNDSNFSKSTVAKIVNTKRQLHAYLVSTNKIDLCIEDVDKTLFSAFKNYGLEIGYAKSTINKRLSIIKQVFNYAVNCGYIESNPFLLQQISRERKPIIYLSQKELRLIENYTPRSEKMEKVKDCFIFSCYTGMAYAEVKNFTLDDIELINGSEAWIHIKRKKTNKGYHIPILKEARMIIDKYKDLGRIPIMSNQKFNDYIKIIGKELGIKKHLTHHLCRRTFATTVLLSKGVPMEIVSKLLGHSSSKITQEAYAHINKTLISKTLAEKNILQVSTL